MIYLALLDSYPLRFATLRFCPFIANIGALLNIGAMGLTQYLVRVY